MRRNPSYRDLTRLLLDHGFQMEQIKGSHNLFLHPSSGTTILLPPDCSSRAAMPSQVTAIRRQLDERGVLSRDDFDLEIQGANGTAKSRG